MSFFECLVSASTFGGISELLVDLLESEDQ